jgi:hypothetical protein
MVISLPKRVYQVSALRIRIEAGEKGLRSHLEMSKCQEFL